MSGLRLKNLLDPQSLRHGEPGFARRSDKNRQPQMPLLIGMAWHDLGEHVPFRSTDKIEDCFRFTRYPTRLVDASNQTQTGYVSRRNLDRNVAMKLPWIFIPNRHAAPSA